jgi:hypothetical protein
MVKLGEVVKTMEVCPFVNVLPPMKLGKVKPNSKNKDLDELKIHKRTRN